VREQTVDRQPGLSVRLKLTLSYAGFLAVTIVEPGGFATDWSGSSARHADPMPGYAFVREAAARRRGGHSPGDPAAAAQALLEVVGAERPPLRVLFGAQAPEVVEGIYARRLQTWKDWEHTAKRAQGDRRELPRNGDIGAG
jgi:hypothetical protein